VQSTNARAVPHLREAAFGQPGAETIGTAFASAAGAAEVQDLRAMNAAALTDIGLKTGFMSQPIIDGVLIPDQLVNIFDQDQQTKVSILAGFNSGEIRSQRALIPQMPNNAAAYEEAIAARYGNLARAYLKLYPASDIGESQLASTRDVVYAWATERIVRKMAAADQPSYLYIFDHCHAAARTRDLCAFHASELPFVFGLVDDPDSMPPNWPKTNTAEDIHLARNMIDYWTSFAATGVPRAHGAPAWPDYGKHETYIRFTAAPTLGRNPYPGMFELHEDVMHHRRANGQQWFL
jgi:para-nitrobenzyl esterase